MCNMAWAHLSEFALLLRPGHQADVLGMQPVRLVVLHQQELHLVLRLQAGGVAVPTLHLQSS